MSAAGRSTEMTENGTGASLQRSLLARRFGVAIDRQSRATSFAVNHRRRRVAHYLLWCRRPWMNWGGVSLGDRLRRLQSRRRRKHPWSKAIGRRLPSVSRRMPAAASFYLPGMIVDRRGYGRWSERVWLLIGAGIVIGVRGLVVDMPGKDC